MLEADVATRAGNDPVSRLMNRAKVSVPAASHIMENTTQSVDEASRPGRLKGKVEGIYESGGERG
jgi:hypothetical protein